MPNRTIERHFDARVLGRSCRHGRGLPSGEVCSAQRPDHGVIRGPVAPEPRQAFAPLAQRGCAGRRGRPGRRRQRVRGCRSGRRRRSGRRGRRRSFQRRAARRRSRRSAGRSAGPCPAQVRELAQDLARDGEQASLPGRARLPAAAASAAPRGRRVGVSVSGGGGGRAIRLKGCRRGRCGQRGRRGLSEARPHGRRRRRFGRWRCR